MEVIDGGERTRNEEPAAPALEAEFVIKHFKGC